MIEEKGRIEMRRIDEKHGNGWTQGVEEKGDLMWGFRKMKSTSIGFERQ